MLGQSILRHFLFGLACAALFLCPPTLSAEVIEDPLEPVNRGIFWFNDTFDIYIAEPVARGYEKIIPNQVRTSISNFFDNLGYPSQLVSDVAQLKFGQALDHTSRFVISSTMGVAGFFDVAKSLGYEKKENDFGLALAYHDVPPGPYLVLPFLGPSNVRDGFGKIVDFALDPFSWVGSYGLKDHEELTVQLAARSVQFINTRANLLEAVKAAKESSLDYYLFMQGAYYQYRQGLLYDGQVPAAKALGDEEEDIFKDIPPEPAKN